MSEHTLRVYESILGLLANEDNPTPMVRLSRVVPFKHARIFAKLEWYNPFGAVKDRVASSMVRDAEDRAAIVADQDLVEPTSGNTGVGLAIVAAQRGYKCVFVMTDKVAPEKVDLLRAYGAEVVVCSVAVPPEDPDSYYSTAARLVKEIPGAYQPSQYHNPVNPQSHYETTGPEIWQQTDGRVTHFVAGAGTGGTISGIGRYLKEQNPAVQIVAADPEGSVYSGGSGRPYLVEGVGEDFFPSNYHADVIDRTIAVSDRDSFLTARQVSEQEGLLIGGSCGTAVKAALEVAEGCGPDDLVVVLLPDSGRLYLSKVFNDDWMAGFGFLRSDGPVVSDVVDSRRAEVPDLVYVQPGDPARDAVALMHKHGVSQLPVAKGEMPLAAAEVMGSVSELRLMDVAFGDESVLDTPVGEIMGPRLPTIGAGQPVAMAVEMLESTSALLVLDGGRPRSVISSSDVLSFLSKGANRG